MQMNTDIKQALPIIDYSWKLELHIILDTDRWSAERERKRYRDNHIISKIHQCVMFNERFCIVSMH